jgi:maltose alpha-D-glucosyltransferase / alpha-amylase
MEGIITPQQPWFKDAIIYQLNIKSFFDANNDGSGDINGLVEKLDYLEDLGVNCLSLMPFFESPFKDDGYDIADYYNIHSDFGTTEQFQRLLTEAHKRGIRIIIDFILNHTSTKHAWFQRAKKADPLSTERNFYIWSDNPEKFSEAETLFKDYESSNWTWDNDAKAYYMHRFFSHQADLNYDNDDVREELRKVLDYWFSMGVDGAVMRSVSYLYKREGTNCENLPEVHAFLKRVRKYVNETYPDKILIADTNQWPEDATAYFGEGDECHLNYHFPLMPRLYMALQTEDSYPIVDIMEQTPPTPEGCQWALFLRNHDDLTLSMVTEEERDYMYKMFAQDHGAKINEGIRRRLAPLLGNDRRKIELLNSLLFSLPGTPVLYYGDEIGMGDNIYLGDRNGIRTPMQWNADRNAGFSNGNPQKLFLPVIRDPAYRYESINVEVQSKNTASLLWWMKNIISMRKRLKALSQGETRFLDSGNSKVLAYVRHIEGESVLIVANLSKYSQAAEVKLKEYKGNQPIEIFSQNKFFEITDSPYSITLGPYSYYWFLLEQNDEYVEKPVLVETLSQIESEVEWEGFFDHYTSKRKFLKQALPTYMRTCRWFGGKSRSMVSVDIDRYPAINVKNTVDAGNPDASGKGSHSVESKVYFAQIDVRYTDGLPETYSLPLAFITDAAEILQYLKNKTNGVLCYFKTPMKEGILVDALHEESFRTKIFELMQNDEKVSTTEGVLRFEPGTILKNFKVEKIQSEILKAEQSNTSVIYNDQFFFKIYRKLDTDINPDLELVRFLSEKTNFENSPRYGGGIEFFDNNTKSFIILGLLQNKIQNQGEAWTSTLEALTRYYEKVFEKVEKSTTPPPLMRKARTYFEDVPSLVQKLIGSVTYERVTLLARRTAEMHLALSLEPEDADFQPERFTQNYQRSIYSGHRKLVAEKFNALEQRIPKLPEHIRGEALQILDLKDQIIEAFEEIFKEKIEASKTRIHGDYHLGQVLFNGKDYFIIDFEGEPMHAISERRLKKTPFKDVAGMMRSFHYAAYGQLVLNQNYRKEDMPFLEQWALQWYHYVSQFYLTAYLDRCGEANFMPPDEAGKQMLLRTYMLEKAIYEVGYEMNARPDWLRVPMRGVLYVMDEYLKGK